MKKRVSIIICICSMLALISCGEVAETSSTVSTASEVSSTASNEASSMPLNSGLESGETNEVQGIPPIYSDSADAILLRIINSENWYHGDYSIFDELCGEKLTVECVEDQSGGEYLNHYFFELDGKIKYLLVSAGLIYTDPYIYEYKTCSELEKSNILDTLDIDGQNIVESTFELTVDNTPTDPNKLSECEEETLSDEVESEIDKIIECIDKGFSYSGKVYIRQVGTPCDRSWRSNTETVAFLEDELTGNVICFLYSADYYQCDDESEAYGINENKVIKQSDKAEWYYYQKVKKTTDWVIDMGEMSSENHTDEEVISELTGTWWGQDAFGRCHVEFVKISDEKYSVTAEWASSAAENTIWTMTISYDSHTNTYIYDDCTRRNTDDYNETEDVIYENGKGHFLIHNNYLYWTDEKEDYHDIAFKRDNER